MEGWAVAISQAPSQPCWFNLNSLVRAEHIHVSKATTVFSSLGCSPSLWSLNYCTAWSADAELGKRQGPLPHTSTNLKCSLSFKWGTFYNSDVRAREQRMDYNNGHNRLLLKPDSLLMIKTIEGVYLTTGSPKWTLPLMNAPPKERSPKWTYKKCL